MKDKVDPYMQPLYDALNDILPGKQVSKLIEEKRIEIAPLAFMRGRTLANAFVVLDEAQNATTDADEDVPDPPGRGQPHGHHRRPHPDRPAARGVLRPLGCRTAVSRASTGSASATSPSKDVVRHPLVARIIEAYEADETSA